MKLSDYVIGRIEREVADAVFLLSGGGAMHLVDSIGRSKLQSYCCHHEQAAAIAAEGYARTRNGPGVVCVTSGPGATNAITGVAGAWLDSIPLLVISGQVKRDNLVPRKNNVPQIRALGFQELNIIDMVRPITKYAVLVEDAQQIRYHFERALHAATSGRPGPVWLDIPLDVQAADIDPKLLPGFTPPPPVAAQFPFPEIVRLLAQAKQPLLMVGNGVRLSGGVAILEKVLQKFNPNVVTALFTSDDLVTYDYPRYLGRQGMWGNPSANYAVDNCDVLLVVGERMQLTQTSYAYEKFATQAKIIMVDIDPGELRKKTLRVDVPVCGDAKAFLKGLYACDFQLERWDVPVQRVKPEEFTGKTAAVNVYRFIAALSECAHGAPVVTANATAAIASHQALQLSRGQRLMTNAGLGHMGSGLPMAVGACVATGKQPVICLEGDGSIMLNLHELQTVLHHQLPLKIFILNNNGYKSIVYTHRRYFGRIFAATPETGVSFPNFGKLVLAWGLPFERIATDAELGKLKEVMAHPGPIVCEVVIDRDQPMIAVWEAGQLRRSVQ